MYSRARIFGHPIHPMIVPLPIASYILGMVSLIVFTIVGDPFWMGASYWLAITGVVTGLVAAVPGLIDWATIPGRAAAKGVGTWHMVINVSIVALFFVSWLLLGGVTGPAAADITAPLILQILGSGWLIVSGWLGGEMVYRHHVSIEPVSEDERQMVDEYERRRAA